MPQHLTADFLHTVEKPGTYWDDEVTGFGARLNAGGAKSFFLNYRVDSREKRITIGRFPRWSVAAARSRAKELRIEIDRGIDPAGQKRERREAPTMADLIARYIDEHSSKKPKSKHRAADEKKMLAEIGDRLGLRTKVADIHQGDTGDMHRKITESGRPVRANRILALASTMFGLSLVPRPGENLPWRDTNPCKGVKRNHEEGRERFFGEAELAAISDALNDYQGRAADCVRLVMLSGCRPSEARQAQWLEFDTEPGFWVKPSAHTKQRKVHRLPLSPAAVELVERLRERRTDSALMFPGDRLAEPLATLTHVWNHVRQRAGLTKSDRLYDLRHTFASIGAGGGLSLPIIGRLLGHTVPRTTQRYAHLADDPLREAAERITSVIVGAGKLGAKVVPIKGR
jgi:integrase